jgi:hypothetical protein
MVAKASESGEAKKAKAKSGREMARKKCRHRRGIAAVAGVSCGGGGMAAYRQRSLWRMAKMKMAANISSSHHRRKMTKMAIK